MGKLIASIILSLSLLFLVREALVSFAPEQDRASGENAQKKSRPQPVLPQEKMVAFYPPVPPVLPDLNQGYLFNAERFLPGDKDEEGGEPVEGEETDKLVVDIAKVYYVGSVIIGDSRKGLIVYPPQETAPPGPPGRTMKAPSAKARNYAQLIIGDGVSGYKVTAIEPDRLVLQKGEETIEKMLNDPNKVRIAPPPPAPKAKAPATQNTRTVRTTQSAPALKAPTSSRRTQTTRRVPAPRTLPDNIKIQTPGVPRNN